MRHLVHEDRVSRGGLACPHSVQASRRDRSYLANFSFSAPGWNACRTCALSNAAKPKAYSASSLSNWTSNLLPVTSLRDSTVVQTPSFQAIAASMSPRSPANFDTMIDATSSPAWNLLSSNGTLASA